MRLEDFVIPKLFDSLGLASNAKLFGEAQVRQRSRKARTWTTAVSSSNLCIEPLLIIYGQL